MNQLYIQLTAESPLAIRSDHAAGGVEAAHYIPGTAFLGSLAAVHRMLYPNATEEFKQLFLDERILYPNLYPAVFMDKGLRVSNIPVYPVPKTAQSCKRHPGFLFPEVEENDGHGVRDSLINWALFKIGEQLQVADPLVPLLQPRNKVCARCDAAMDHFSGYYRRSENASEETAATSENVLEDITATNEPKYMRLQTHTGIDRESGTVQEGILYNRNVFEEGMRFWGAISVPDDAKLLGTLTDFFKQVGQTGLVRVGTGRTRGMGRVTFNAKLVQDEPASFTSFCKRLNKFHNLLCKEAGTLALQDRYFFALTLHSPLILVDNFLRYQGTLDDLTLKKLLGCDETIEINRIYQSAQMQRMTGWLEIWGVPRMNEYAIETGSVFLFSCNAAQDTPANEALLRQLFKLEEQGIGKRRAEGFGRVRVSDQFHSDQFYQEGEER
jgi:CRISPR-associated protein Csx10